MVPNRAYFQQHPEIFQETTDADGTASYTDLRTGEVWRFSEVKVTKATAAKEKP